MFGRAQTFGISTPYVALAFVLIIGLMTGVALLGLKQVRSLNDKAELLRQKEIKTEHIHRMRNAVRERFIRLGLLVISDDPFQQDAYLQEFNLMASRFMVARGTVENMVNDPQEVVLLDELRSLTATGSPIQDAVVEAALAGDNARAKKIMFEASLPIQEAVMAQTDRVLALFEQANASAFAEMEQERQRTHRLMTAMAIIQTMLALLIAMVVIRHAHSQHQGMQKEITRRRQSEQQLREAQDGLERQVQERTLELNRFKSTLDRTLDCVFMFDAATLRFFYFNEGALRQVGYTRDELLAMHPYDIKPDVNETQFHALIEPLLKREKDSLTFESVHQHKDGQRIPVENFLQYIAPEGEAARFVAIVRDITERKRVDRMKSEFVSTVSHELRTPLTSISGALGLVAGGALGELPSQAREMVGIAHKNSQRLTHLINDLLDMEKITAGKLHFDLQVQPLSPLIEQALEANRAYGAERRVSLILSGEVPDVEVRVDSQRLMQVMSNLLSNAFKFSPEAGEVNVGVAVLGASVRVTVSDQGPGIPTAFRDRIFQKFAQADSSDTRQKGGTGLGLAITRKLVERMGGQIGFESEEWHGARFHFELPVWHTQTSDDAAAPSNAAPRILVVEDEPDVARLLGLMLTRAGYRVHTAATGAAALQALQHARYAAMTLDLMLPDISGLEIIRQLRQQAATADLPIIVVSAKMEAGKLAISNDFSGIDWLAKPIDDKQLLGIVDHLVATADQPHQRLLHVEDDRDLHQVIRAMVGAHFDVESATSLHQARARLAAQRFDAIILDLSLPDGSGWALLTDIRSQQPAARVIILTGSDTTADEARKVEAVLLKSQVDPLELLEVLSDRIYPSSNKGKTL